MPKPPQVGKPPHPHKPPPTLSRALAEMLRAKDVLPRPELAQDEQVRLGDAELVVSLR